MASSSFSGVAAANAVLPASLADAFLNATAGLPLKASLGSGSGSTPGGFTGEARLFSAIEAHRFNALRLARTEPNDHDETSANGSSFATTFSAMFSRSGEAVSGFVRQRIPSRSCRS